jgi:hypothetical protein
MRQCSPITVEDSFLTAIGIVLLNKKLRFEMILLHCALEITPFFPADLITQYTKKSILKYFRNFRNMGLDK